MPPAPEKVGARWVAGRVVSLWQEVVRVVVVFAPGGLRTYVRKQVIPGKAGQMSFIVSRRGASSSCQHTQYRTPVFGEVGYQKEDAFFIFPTRGANLSFGVFNGLLTLKLHRSCATKMLKAFFAKSTVEIDVTNPCTGFALPVLHPVGTLMYIRTSICHRT